MIRYKLLFLLAPILALCFAISTPAKIERTIEWRTDGLWVFGGDTGPRRFPPLANPETDDIVNPKVAELSPDEGWIAFVRHTGGGFENEGQSCYVAKFDGTQEKLILKTDRAIPSIYWLEGNGKMFIVVQQQSGGTSYGSYFSVVDFETAKKITDVEGIIYGTTMFGTRALSTYPKSLVGLKYEVLCQNEDPCGWGVFNVDELLEFPPESRITFWAGSVDYYLIDGKYSTAWVQQEKSPAKISLEFTTELYPSGVFIVVGWARHEPPVQNGYPWQGHNNWDLYGRPRMIELTFSDGTSTRQELEDTASPQWIAFPDGMKTDKVDIAVQSVYRGRDFDKVAISEIYLQ
jgi:hypothetical protein